MNENEAVAWLGRKVGWGFHNGQYDEWAALGPTAVIDQLVHPDDHGITSRPDPFADLEFDRDDQGAGIRTAVVSWIEHAIVSPRPLETFMEFFWSDYFAVSMRVVRPRQAMLQHMNLLAEHALGNFSDLLRAVTLDPAMLSFLDGGLNTKDSPNENYGRELLELYSVGVGEFTEADVKAAAKALTGYRLNRRTGTVRFVARRHEDTPQTLLGVGGVNDVDTTIDAVLAHPATAPRVVDKLATAILGTGYDASIVQPLSATFADDWELRPVIEGLLRLGVDGHAVPSIIEPLAWYVSARRVPTGRPRPGPLREFFRLGGQIPMFPPTVGGFPEPDAYLSTSATLARFNLASHLAETAARGGQQRELRDATDDLDAFAERLGLVGGFAPTTKPALESLTPGIDRLAAALASPDLVVA